MSNSTYNQLTSNLELLKLTQMKLHLDEIRDFVTTNGLSFTEGLLKLSNYEVDFKEQNASRSMIKAAAFPFVKELKDYDFEFQPSVNEQEMRELTSLPSLPLANKKWSLFGSIFFNKYAVFPVDMWLLDF